MATVAIGSANSGIWADDANGIRQLVVRTGTIAPGTVADVFASLSDPVYNSNNAVAFTGTLKIGVGDVVTLPVNNSVGIWSNDGGTLHMVARQGQQAPGLASGAVFASFGQFVLPDQGGASNMGGVVLLANVSGKGVVSASNQGIWAVDTSGKLQLVLRTGGSLNGKVITGLAFLTSATQEAGQTRSYSQSTGDLLVKCTFSDGSWKFVQVVFP